MDVATILRKENARFAQQTISKKCQAGIFEIGCSQQK